MCDPGNIREVGILNPDMMGFIFYKGSKRFAGMDPDLSMVPATVEKTGVFVNENKYVVLEMVKKLSLDMVQLHGDESPAYCNSLRKFVTVIKAFGVAGTEDIQKTVNYENAVDHFLFDNRSPLYGGTGRQFDHELLSEYKGEISYFLSGGIGSGEVAHYRKFHSDPRLFALDLNSRFEKSPGIKDTDELKKIFI